MAWLSDWYLWILSGHIISIIAWMAGMFYLPRLFVYHADTEVGSDKSETFKIMERRLLRAIINPAMTLAWIFGILLVLTPGIVDWAMGWPWVKAALVLAMSGLHGLLSRWRRHFASDRNIHSARFYRLMNEVPTVMMIGIVIMVVTKPF
ncbi:MAG: protoporphyrinogen oxidase HemJ [Alphaproteobacteria bacterium]|jgi:protoporphyrinogen IX oxidase|nr:protoporphyrinogen oxidase HemJ [Alphaproteobacteria bacterium]MBT5859684.1 protoporphyrinogen oxidase HemJ [Alphaproteobacteria bacterium]